MARRVHRDVSGRTAHLGMSGILWSAAGWTGCKLVLGGGVGHAISLEGFMDDYITHIIRHAGSPLNILTEEDIFPGLVGQSLQCLFAVRCALCTVNSALCTVSSALCSVSSAL